MSDNKNKDTADTRPKATGDPLQGAKGDPNRVPSAPEAPPAGVASLLEMAHVDAPEDPTTAPADRTDTVVVERDGQKFEAARTESGENGAFGIALPVQGEVAGGNIAKTLDPPPDPSTLNQPLTKERAALLSPIGRKLMPFIARPPAEWGILAPGDVVRGHMLLLDLNSGEKVRGMDGHRVNDGELYANLRNLPEALSSGDTIEQVLGAL